MEIGLTGAFVFGFTQQHVKRLKVFMGNPSFSVWFPSFGMFKAKQHGISWTSMCKLRIAFEAQVVIKSLPQEQP